MVIKWIDLVNFIFKIASRGLYNLRKIKIYILYHVSKSSNYQEENPDIEMCSIQSTIVQWYNIEEKNYHVFLFSFHSNY